MARKNSQGPAEFREALGSPTYRKETFLSDRSFSWKEGLFVDLSFPTWDVRSNSPVVWKRPKDICAPKTPLFIADGASRMDVVQGKLNNCWFLSAVSSLSLYPRLMRKVVPEQQSFQDNYNGSFHFYFWQYGEWKKVMIDDLLPLNDTGMMYLQSSQDNEFWSALLEKAYAKLKGGYSTLDLGFPHEALVDLTGGVTETFQVSPQCGDLAAFLKPLLMRGVLINCGSSAGSLGQARSGIQFKHAYSLTGLETVQTMIGPIQLVRLQNPWGHTEWEGPWSDINGTEWNMVSPEEQKRLERVKRDDGEFWMSVSDFCLIFDTIEVCHLSDETLSKKGIRPWRCKEHHGSWTRNSSAGGPHKGEWYSMNPQYLFTLKEEDDDPDDPQLTCSFMVALMQKHHRLNGMALNIGVHIFKVATTERRLSTQELYQLTPVCSTTPPYAPYRETVFRGRLEPGSYVIIPSTMLPNQEGEFLLRILTEKPNQTTLAQSPKPTSNIPAQPTSPVPSVLPSMSAVQQLFQKHCRNDVCRPAELYNLLMEAIGGGVMAESVKKLTLDQCKSFVVLMDAQGPSGKLNWTMFVSLWDMFLRWAEIFVKCDKNKSQSLDYSEIDGALRAAGIEVDDVVLQVIAVRYTEPDMTVSFPGFLYLVMKYSAMMRKFQNLDKVGQGIIQLNGRQWLYHTLFN